jgi:predicted nucleotidyltransferase
MKIIRSDAELDLVTLYPLGDWHLGSEHCDVKLIKKQIETIKQDKTARVILMGDLAETATKESVGAGVYEQSENAQQQMMKVKNLLYDIRHIIDGAVTGNHEERIYKQSGFDLTLYLCQMLFGYCMAWVRRWWECRRIAQSFTETKRICICRCLFDGSRA